MNNRDVGLYIRKCNGIEFGNVTIANNHSPSNGGGMWIYHGRIMASQPNTTVSFINKGVGGAIYIDTADVTGN